MRFTSPLAVLLALGSPAFAASDVRPADHIATNWIALPTGRFTADEHRVAVHIVSARAAAISDGAVAEAIASASDITARRDLDIDEMASAWDHARRAALEDLRDAQRAYVAIVGGDRDLRNARFAALLHQVVDGTGRSAVKDDQGVDEALSTSYDQVIRTASDGALPAIQGSQEAWARYRDAFDRFASAMDRPESARSVHEELARHRADDLQAAAGK